MVGGSVTREEEEGLTDGRYRSQFSRQSRRTGQPHAACGGSRITERRARAGRRLQRAVGGMRVGTEPRGRAGVVVSAARG